GRQEQRGREGGEDNRAVAQDGPRRRREARGGRDSTRDACRVRSASIHGCCPEKQSHARGYRSAARLKSLVRTNSYDCVTAIGYDRVKNFATIAALEHDPESGYRFSGKHALGLEYPRDPPALPGWQ